MAKKLKPKRKGVKRGPKEERLIVTGDPKVALDRLLKKPASH
ncbi:MAG: hypothetical protein WBD07_00415 [Vicinamibacterales bacterium]